jgi:16S rRNA processing protein RimM
MLFGDPIEDPDTLWVHELIGAHVVDVDGQALGLVESVLENPASDILVLEGDRFIPLTFYVEWRDDGTIVVDLPDGLFDPIDADKS